MAVTVRLKRLGSKNKPFYRLVAIDKLARRDGMVLEELGTYNPTSTPTELNLKTDQIKAWLAKGAILTDASRRILATVGLAEKGEVKGPARGEKRKKKEKVSKAEKKAIAAATPVAEVASV